MRFSPTGEVHACCVNDQFPLGRIGEQSIADIWRGSARARLRDALDRADYSLGCRDCEADYLSGHRLQTHAEQFDRYPEAPPPPWPKRLELALSNTCNLQCVHCNGDLSSAIRAQREHRPPLRSPYDDAFFEELREVLPHVEVAVFIGGEPFLARECQRVWDLLIEMDLHPEVHVTTNGTVWNDRVEHYLHALCMNVAVSIDGATSATNDAIRVGSSLDEVAVNRDRFVAATRSYGAAFCWNHCLMVQNWRELAGVLLEADRLDLGVHVIPVTYPTRYSLYALPADDLAPIVLGLEEQGEELVRRLDPARGSLTSWEATLAHLRDHMQRLEAVSPRGPAAPVPVTLEPRRRPATPNELDALRGELHAWAGQDLLVVRAEEGVVLGVEAPDWAALLDAERWVGWRLEALQADVIGLLGELDDLVVEQPGPRIQSITCTVRSGGSVVPIRTVVIDEWGLLIATPCPALELSG